MNNIDSSISLIKNEIMNEECVKQYLFYREQISKNKELISLYDEMKKHQKIMCENKNNNEIYTKERNIYDDLRSKFESNPLVVNMLAAKEEVRSFLNDIKNILGEEL